MVVAPLVSVLMLTRNHAPFIGQAIASVQAQSLWPQLELLIGDDDSDDGTTALVTQAAQQHPDRIRFWTSPSGALGFHYNFARLLAAARAPYVAFLEGDDWWCDYRKLELQWQLLESSPELAFCGCRTRLQPGHAQIGPPPGTRRLGFAQLVEAYSFHFSAVLMRRSAVELPPWTRRQYCLDRPLYLLAACHGDAGVVDAVMSVYRQHSGGIWSSLSPLQQARRSATLFSAMAQAFGQARAPLFRQALRPVLTSYLERALGQGRRAEAAMILVLLMLRTDPRAAGMRWWAAAGRRLLWLPARP
ncbi:MAG: glycosyltransferase [Cyanobacteriota bacterium]|nr:glycosyltransferase [Cyanobacteriota bacterium]